MALHRNSFQPRSRRRRKSTAERQREFRDRYPHYNRLVKAWQRGDLQGLLPDWTSRIEETAPIRALFRSEQAEKVAEVLQARLLLPPAERKSLPAPAGLFALPAPAESSALPSPAQPLALPAPV